MEKRKSSFYVVCLYIEAESFLERRFLMDKVKSKSQIKKDPDVLMNSMYDRIFKAIIQHLKFRKILSMIISNVTLYSESYIYENLKFLNPELPVENAQERNKITDILVSIKGNIINIEANRSAQASI